LRGARRSAVALGAPAARGGARGGRDASQRAVVFPRAACVAIRHGRQLRRHATRGDLGLHPPRGGNLAVGGLPSRPWRLLRPVLPYAYMDEQVAHGVELGLEPVAAVLAPPPAHADALPRVDEHAAGVEEAPEAHDDQMEAPPHANPVQERRRHCDRLLLRPAPLTCRRRRRRRSAARDAPRESEGPRVLVIDAQLGEGLGEDDAKREDEGGDHVPVAARTQRGEPPRAEEGTQRGERGS
jgi:hypothetical protein